MSKIQWFPGHMTKTIRNLEKIIKDVDFVVEIVDARIPLSSRNPVFDEIVRNKSRIMIINKKDIADETLTSKWVDYYSAVGMKTISVNSKTGKDTKNFLKIVKDILNEKKDKLKSKGILNVKLTFVILGVPNVGKSSFINRIADSKSAKVEDRPGVTRGLQRVSINQNIDMIDVPGLLWPKFEDESVGEKLAFTGAVKDYILDINDLAVKLIENLRGLYEQNIITRYKLNSDLSGLDSHQVLSEIGRKRGMLVSGGHVDIERASVMVLDEYRQGKLGNITLEVPPDIN